MARQNLQNQIVGNDRASMVLIHAGEFLMGATDGDDMGYTREFQKEKPQHVVYLDAFYINIFQATNAQYKKFMEATGHRAPGQWNKPEFNAPNNPVVGVGWYDAVAYAEGAGKRLPTEAEWENAARGGLVNARYPWGDKPLDGIQCNFKDRDTDTDILYDETINDGYRYTAPVGSYPPNGYGLYDMAGNVFEWCADDRMTTPYPKSKTRLVRLMAQIVRFVAVISWDRFFMCAVLAAVPVQPASPQAIPVFVVSYRLKRDELVVIGAVRPSQWRLQGCG